MNQAMLDIQELQVHFHTPEGIARAVDHVSLKIGPGETVGLVGESGCGKSLTNLAIMGLLPEKIKVDCDKLQFDDFDLTKISEKKNA